MISPPAWGWPDGSTSQLFVPDDFPTRVGMARTDAHQSACLRRFPHPRGDGPEFHRRIAAGMKEHLESIEKTWGPLGKKVWLTEAGLDSFLDQLLSGDV